VEFETNPFPDCVVNNKHVTCLHVASVVATEGFEFMLRGSGVGLAAMAAEFLKTKALPLMQTS